MAEKKFNTTLAENRKARHDYTVLETIECGMVLSGTEVKSVRHGEVSLAGAYGAVLGGELWLVGADIAAYKFGNRFNHEPKSQRKLLVHAKEIRELTKNYDGFAWYATSVNIPADWFGKRDIYLYFGAVDESAWVYLNGKLCGTQIYKGGDDWKKPFTIPITGQIDWKKGKQHLFVRVEDNGGLGGLWRPVMLICREKK